MRINTVLSSLLVLGMLTMTVACESQPEQAGASGGPQPPAVSATTPTDASRDWIGKTAPSFSLPDTDGKTIDVSKVLGTKPVVLVFYRGVW
jgi:hypothetical protein